MSTYEQVLFGGVILISLLAGAIWLSNTCQKRGSGHRWVRHPDHFRSRVCVSCGRRETLMREWEYVGIDKKFKQKAKS